MKEKEVLLGLLPKTGRGAAALLEAAPKLKADLAAAAGAGAGAEFDPAELLKLLDLRGLAVGAEELELLTVPIPLKGLLAAATGAAVVVAPNEKGADVGAVTLD